MINLYHCKSQHLDNDDFIVHDTYANVQTSTQQASNQFEIIAATDIVAQEVQENTSQPCLDLNFPLTFDDNEFDYIEEELAEERIREEVETIEDFPNSIFTSSDVNCIDFDFTNGQYDIGDHDFQVEEEDDTLVNSMNVYPIDDDSQTSELYLHQVFSDRDGFKRALTNYCIKRNFELRRIQSNSHYIKVGCKEPNCYWTLPATGKENRFFPVAFAVTEIEKIETWEWFLDELLRCFSGFRELSIMSDRNLGIIVAVRNIFLDAAHEYCMVHLAKNLVHDVRSKDVVPLFWAVARSTTEHSFNECMQKILDIHE
ncbi:hypothetical protein Cni_G10143 [Canna indica]|uniref:Transposase MuDR plant domain-containing protein n=1 Tax=Canna indica TaxID=4628 RepID=A0AAQ3K784_9LILI|nr:hypothetical protein Cni_G10143 [Canna indica]